MARLVEAVAAGKPSAVAIDILFAQADNRSPAALARQLGALTGKQDLSALAGDLPDGDKRLAAAIRSVPATLGFVLDADNANMVPGVPVLARHPVVLDGIWRMTGGIAPLPPLIDATKGLGALSLPGDADGKIRRVPLLVGVADATRPGLALEAVRLAISYMTPVFLLSDGYLANGAEPWLMPQVSSLPKIVNASSR